MRWHKNLSENSARRWLSLSKPAPGPDRRRNFWISSRPALRRLAGLALAGLFVLPFYWALVASLRQPGLPPLPSVEWWPAAPQWDNYPAIFRLLPFGRYLLNSLIVVTVAVPLTLLTASLAGFGMALLPRRERRRLLLFSVALLLVPASAVWLFRYQIFSRLGLLDSLWALIAPAFAGSSPLFVLLFYWTFRSVPAEVYEAARLDGAGAWTCWRLVGLSLARPTLLAVVVLSFLLYWSDFTGPVLYIFDSQRYTLAVGLQILKQYDQTNTPLLMAGAVLMTVPIVALLMVFQQRLFHGLSLANLFGRNS